MIKVLICEDSLPVSQLLTELISSDPELQVVGVAGNGVEAIELNRKLRPDIITMDVRMPQLNGLEATRRIMAEQPTPIVLVSELVETDVALSMEALNAGALALLPKPYGFGHPGFKANSERLRQTLRLMSSVKVVRHWLKPAPKAVNEARGLAVQSENGGSLSSSYREQTRPRCAPRLIAIGSSTGGPSALATLLGQLPANFDVPIVITQHIMPGFAEGLARWLKDATGRQVMLAQEGMYIKPNSGQTIIAPDHCHMLISPSWQVRFDRRGLFQGVLPSVNLMFDSVAEAVGSSAVGVLLTGMGQDGAQGLYHLHQMGAYTIAQDEASCVVFGMPKEAIAQGAVNKVVAIEKIASVLVGLLHR